MSNLDWPEDFSPEQTGETQAHEKKNMSDNLIPVTSQAWERVKDRLEAQGYRRFAKYVEPADLGLRVVGEAHLLYGYGIVDKDGETWWDSEVCVSNEVGLLADTVSDYNDHADEDPRTPYRVVELVVQEIEEDK